MKSLALWLLLALSAQAEIRHVIAISVDGGRGDFIQGFIDSAPNEYPNLTRMRALSAATFNARCDFTESITIPNHLAMLTGRPVRQPDGLPASLQHGIISNGPAPEETVHNSGLNPGVYKASIFDVVHDHGMSTAIYYGKGRLDICARSWDADNGAEDLTGPNNGRNKVDVRELRDATDPAATASLVEDLVGTIQGSTLKNFTFLHLADTDYAGHAYGWDPTPGSRYRTAMRLVDGWLGQILDAIFANPIYAGHTAIMITADHGGGTPFITHGEPYYQTNYTIPFVLMAPGMTGGTSIYQWMNNRTDAGADRPEYTAGGQPMRNSDVANVSAALLGLPAVAGSLVQAEFKKPMLLAHVGGTYTVSWPVYLTGYTLEAADSLAAPRWTPVVTNIDEKDGWLTHTVSAPAPPAQRFFRLRPPETLTIVLPAPTRARVTPPATRRPTPKLTRSLRK